MPSSEHVVHGSYFRNIAAAVDEALDSLDLTPGDQAFDFFILLAALAGSEEVEEGATELARAQVLAYLESLSGT